MERSNMQNSRYFLLFSLLVVAGNAGYGVSSEDSKHQHEDDEQKSKHECPFIFREARRILKTDAGEIQAFPGTEDESHMGLYIIKMEPKALLLPQYVDASCVINVIKGRLTLGMVGENNHRSFKLEAGDLYAIPGGQAFYILNTDQAQRLELLAMFDASEHQTFFVAGGSDPESILSGFDVRVMATAFKVSREEIVQMLISQTGGPIISTTTEQYQMLRTSEAGFPVSFGGTNFLVLYAGSILSWINQIDRPFNLDKAQSAFENANGRTVAVDENQYPALEKVDMGAFSVSLKPSAMLAPHWNPRASELAYVTKGPGIIQISYPNGINAVNCTVEEGTVFFVPRYFPMCQIATRDGPFEFVGFSTTSRPNEPQFLVGANSVLTAMDADVLSLSSNRPQESLRRLLKAQHDSVILSGFALEDVL